MGTLQEALTEIKNHAKLLPERFNSTHSEMPQKIPINGMDDDA
jgi:hypothetical protein